MNEIITKSSFHSCFDLGRLLNMVGRVHEVSPLSTTIIILDHLKVRKQTQPNSREGLRPSWRPSLSFEAFASVAEGEHSKFSWV